MFVIKVSHVRLVCLHAYRRYSNLKPVDMKQAVGGSPKARHRRTISTSSKDSGGTLRASDAKTIAALLAASESSSDSSHVRQHSDSKS